MNYVIFSHHYQFFRNQGCRIAYCADKMDQCMVSHRTFVTLVQDQLKLITFHKIFFVTQLKKKFPDQAKWSINGQLK